MEASSVIRRLRTAEGTADPYPLYAAARGAGPVLQDASYTLVTAFADADRILRDPGFAAAPQSGHAHAAKLRPPRPAAAVSVLRAEGTDHTRMRRALNPSFQRRRIADLRATVETCAKRLLRPALAAPGGFEFMDAIGYQLPITVICELLGVPESDRPRMRALARARTVFLEPMPEQREIDAAVAAQPEIFALFNRLVRARRLLPREDLVSDLLAFVAAEPAQLTEAELFANLSLLMIAGFETTAGLLGNALALLLAHPEVYDALAEDPALIPAFVDEVLRFDPPVQLVTRTPAGPGAQIAGRPVPPGNLVMVLIGAANRDPARYPDPDVFDPLGRTPAPGLPFGAGPHFCLGAGLAHLEAEVLVQALAAERTRLRAAGPATRPAGRIAIRSLRTLPVRAGG